MGTPPQWKIERHEVLDSTNTRAIQLVRDAFSLPDPRIDHIAIVAHRQTAGRGQHGRTWESPPGGLYLSAILQDIPPAWRPLLPLIAGVTIADALEMLAQDNAKLRWPNDILIDGKKVAGVLCESVAQDSHWAAVIGTGINFNIPLVTLSPSLQNTVTSLHLHNPKPETLEHVQFCFLSALDVRLTHARSHGLSDVLVQARKLDYLYDKRIEFQLDHQILTGTAAGIGDHGELLIDLDNQILPLTHATLLSVDGHRLRP